MTSLFSNGLKVSRVRRLTTMLRLLSETKESAVLAAFDHQHR